jgi:nucleotide-binding universal stress UspA family protein
MPDLEEPAAIRNIVVGVDGSEDSAKALDWAIAEATRFPAFLELVTAWLFPMALGYVFAKTPDEVRQEVQQIA